jgi:redox-sensitive bicupin YhaK (pirin superfamily)
MSSLLNIKLISKQGITRPFGDHRTVKQAFPAGISSELSDPFLMCDYFDMKETNGRAKHPDEFPIDWHPHRGFDIASYLKTGIGRHGDSLGNRETFDTPGMQWMSVGSGVEHAEGGANRVFARVLAGDTLGASGPFKTVQQVEMVDFELKPNASMEVEIGVGLDTAMIYIYEGSIDDLNGSGPLEAGTVVLMDADSNDRRGLRLSTLADNACVMLFAGKKLNEPIAWHGPIVMNTQQQIREALNELRSGTFPPKRVEWDYKHLGAFPPAENNP